MKIERSIIMVLGALLLIGCGGPGRYDAAYTPNMSPPTPADAFLLDEGARPNLIFTPDLEGDLETFSSQNFAVVGESRFNGPEGEVDDALELAKKLGVTHVLVNAKYVYSGNKKAYRFIENYDYIPYAVNYGYSRRVLYDRVPNPVSVPYRKNVPIYHHRAIFLVKMKE